MEEVPSLGQSFETEWRGACQAAREHAATSKRRTIPVTPPPIPVVGFRLAPSSIRAARWSRKRIRPRDHLPNAFVRRQARTKELEDGP
jgi:hypothetical protein